MHASESLTDSRAPREAARRQLPDIGPGRLALVYGLGVAGRAAVDLLLDRGASVLVADDADTSQSPDGWLESGRVQPFDPNEAELPPLDLMVTSPGVPKQRPLIRSALERGVPVIDETTLAWSVLEEARPEVAGRLVAITGSNGKSTTTALTAALFERGAGRPCGNIGTPFSQSVLELLRGSGAEEVLVVELSSFQLEAIGADAPARLRPRAAALLNVSADHLDRHGSAAEYVAAKRRIFAAQRDGDVAVLNDDDPACRDTVLPSGVRRRSFSMNSRVVDGCFVEDEQLWLADPESPARSVAAVSDLQLAGHHNVENLMAAVALVDAIEAVDATETSGFVDRLRSFRGLPHRSELVAEIDGIRWVDDSKGTNVGATMKCLEGWPDGTVHLIAGGRGKGGDFTVLRDLVGRKVRRLYLVGEAAGQMAVDLEGAAPIENSGDIASAVRQAADRATAGDVVLLSPACASFDQFNGFAERGRFFQQQVGTLCHRGGRR